MELTGLVIKGEGLGYKTANLKIAKHFNLPDGVYFAKVIYQNKEYPAIAIRGIRADLEVFLLDFDDDLYGQTLTVEVAQKMRDLIFYEKPEDLLNQIQQDIKQAKKIWETK